MSNIVPFEQQLTLAQSFANSGLFGVKTTDQALALMALCEAEGMHPARAIQEFHIIQGRPAMKADAMLSRFHEAGGSVEWLEYTDEKVSGKFSHPQGGSVTITWTIAEARRIGLTGKDNWKNYPRAMLRSRCIGEGVRTIFPGSAQGHYTVEEVQDMPQGRSSPNAAPVAPEPSNELLHSANEAALFGLKAYSDFWGKLSNDDRKMLLPYHESLKKTASDSDKNRTVDVPTNKVKAAQDDFAASLGPDYGEK